MSGTSMDGIDAALVRTNGIDNVELLGYRETPYSDETRAAIRQQLLAETRTEQVCALEALLTDEHISAVQGLLKECSLDSPRGNSAGACGAAELVGFHGHTLSHAPHRGHTLQIGDGQRMADALGTPVVFDFRSNDVSSGGQGAPLVPVFHRALAAQLSKQEHGTPTALPKNLHALAVVNIGGVSNVTYIDMRQLEHEAPSAEHLIAFDCGPGNAFMDDFCVRNLDCRCDSGGAIAATGSAVEAAVDALLQHEYFAAAAPKSLDRQTLEAAVDSAMRCVPSDATAGTRLATLARMTARSIAYSARHMPALPPLWVVCGGGRHNATLMRMLQEELTAIALEATQAEQGTASSASSGPSAECASSATTAGIPSDNDPAVVPAEAVGWRGDSMEAEAFAFLAVRSVAELPLTFPGTTGVRAPTCGGQHVQPRTCK